MEVYLSNIEFEELLKHSNDLIDVRFEHEYKDKAFYLNENYNWELKKDSVGLLCLIPTKKENYKYKNK
jgi:hypothetical protein